jgi:hypothetical protein
MSLTPEREEQSLSGSREIKSHPQLASGGRDPEDRTVNSAEEVKEKTLDKTLADSFPTSDPPSSIPNPSCDEDGECADQAA